MPQLRLISDANKSPIIPTSEKIIAQMLSITHLISTPSAEPYMLQTTTVTNTLPSIPKAAPSTVFLGLIVGASLCLPKNVPPKYAPLSAPQEKANISIKNKCFVSGTVNSL